MELFDVMLGAYFDIINKRSYNQKLEKKYTTKLFDGAFLAERCNDVVVTAKGFETLGVSSFDEIEDYEFVNLDPFSGYLSKSKLTGNIFELYTGKIKSKKIIKTYHKLRIEENGSQIIDCQIENTVQQKRRDMNHLKFLTDKKRAAMLEYIFSGYSSTVSLFYYWTANIKKNNTGISINIPIDIGTAKELFKFRLPKHGNTKRSPLVNWIREHYRKTKPMTAEEKTTFIKKHFRGQRSFIYSGYTVTITPSESDLMEYRKIWEV